MKKYFKDHSYSLSLGITTSIVGFGLCDWQFWLIILTNAFLVEFFVKGK